LNLLEHLEFLRDWRLAYLAEIRVERRRYLHSMIGLVGVTQVLLPDLATSADEAALGLDGTVVLLNAQTGRPDLSLHPLVVYANEQAYILNSSDLKRTVEYLCHHSGGIYEADRIFEDFKDKFARFLGSGKAVAPDVDAEAVYESCLSMSLLDGFIADDERTYLRELAERLGLSPQRAQELERGAGSRMAPAEAGADDLGPAATTASASGSVGVLERHTRLLKSMGAAVLTYLADCQNPAEPFALPDLARGLAQSYQMRFAG